MVKNLELIRLQAVVQLQEGRRRVGVLQIWGFGLEHGKRTEDCVINPCALIGFDEREYFSGMNHVHFL